MALMEVNFFSKALMRPDQLLAVMMQIMKK